MYIDNITVFVLGCTYFAELIFLIILLRTNFFSKEDQKITPFRRYCSFAISVDALNLALSFVILMFPNLSIKGISFVNAMDGIVLWALLIAGVELISDLKNPVRFRHILGLPFFLIVIVSLCFPRISTIPGQIAILVFGIIEISYLELRFLKHDRRLKDQKSNIESISSSWFGLFLTVIFFELIVWFLVHQFLEVTSWIRGCYLVFVCILYAILAHYAIRQSQTTLKPLEEEDMESTQSETIQIPTSMVKELEEAMEKEKLFLDSDLTLDKLAESLHSNSTYVYRCIHDEIGSTFYDYINNLRIEESKRLLLGSDDKIEDIALKSGFNSSRSMQRTFKRITGLTPTEWRKANSTVSQ